MIVAGFFALLILLVLSAVPTENKDLLNLVVGTLIGSFSGIVSYFFGSSLGSSKKDQLLNEKILILLILLTGCKTKYVPIETIKVQKEIIRDTVVQVELVPYRDTVSILDTVSHLENKVRLFGCRIFFGSVESFPFD